MKYFSRALLSSLGMLGLTGPVTVAQAAGPYPIDFNLGQDAVIALWDLSDFEKDPSAGSITSLHVLPNQVLPATDPETGQADFYSYPKYNSAGQIETLTLDFSLTTGITPSSRNELLLRFPNIQQLYTPIAKRSVFHTVPPGAGVSLWSTQDGSPLDATTHDIMMVQGLFAPFRVILDRSGMNSLTCATSLLESLKDAAKNRGIPPPRVSSLSLLMGQLDQSYEVLESESLMSGEHKTRDFSLSVPVGYGGTRSDPTSLTERIVQAVKAVHPRCEKRPSLPLKDQIALPGFDSLLRYATQNNLPME